jgi:tetratricopeptide (TPR) repeat protein
MGADLDLPDDVYGFGSWLLWVLATRATTVVDEVFAVGPARPSRHYGMADGHPVPTPSLVAWLLTAAEAGLPVSGLAHRDLRLDKRQQVLRTIVSRAIGGEPRLFKESWLRDLAAVCGLGQAELDLLYRCRGEEGYRVDPAALRAAIARTLRGRPDDSGRSPIADGRTPRSLPRDIASFTGREAELEILMAAAGGVVAVCAVGGMAGVGKTAFAVHAAHRLANRFPAGQIFLPLHGHTPGQRPVNPGDALASLLLAAGVPVAQIPPGVEARTALWREWTAGRQLLLVLDDAGSSEQVRPLLPASGQSLVLVTSRRHLSALEDTTAISLDTLTQTEAAALLVRLAGRPELSPTDPAVGEIARLCGCLPLAVGMMARQLHHHPTWLPAGQAADLAAARDRLELMSTENVSVAAAFNLSYEDLAPEHQRLFRRLGLHLGSDIDAYATAALDGVDLAAARRGLEALYDQYLLSEPAQGRYRLHDLIREHARTLAGRLDPDGDRDQAIARLFDYYLHTAAIAEARLARQTYSSPITALLAPPAAVPDLPDRSRALTWARIERANLLAGLDYAALAGQFARVVALTAATAALLRQDGPWTEANARHAAAALAAAHLGDRLGRANALNQLGIARWLVDDIPSSVAALEEALGTYRDLGDRLGEANALSNLGHVRQILADCPGATEVLEQALGIYRDRGDRLGTANALASLGVIRRQTGDYLGAVEAGQEALGIFRDLDDRVGQGNALIGLGMARWQSTDYPGAADSLEQALGIFRDLGDRVGQANALTNLGMVRRQTGDYAGATEALEEAAAVYHDLGSRLGQANALIYLGTVAWRQTGDYAGASESLEEALAVYRDIGDRGGQATALTYLASVWRHAGDYPAAIAAVQEALATFREIGDRGGEVEVINEAGTLYRTRGELDQAEAYHQRALQLAREIVSPWDEAHALAGLARCALAANRIADAVAGLRQALDIFRDMGAAEAADVTAELDALIRAGSAAPSEPDEGRRPSAQ